MVIRLVLSAKRQCAAMFLHLRGRVLGNFLHSVPPGRQNLYFDRELALICDCLLILRSD